MNETGAANIAVHVGEQYYSALDLPLPGTKQIFCHGYTSCRQKLDILCAGRTGKIFGNILFIFAFWGAMATVTQHESLPGGNLFDLLVLLVCSSLMGLLVSFLSCGQLPSLLGMLLAGILLANINVINNIEKGWSISLRNVALVVILLRSGLALDPVALKKLKCTVIRLAFGPCITEALTVTVVAYFLLDLPWLWGLQLGFVLGAVSPAIVVPELLKLQEYGFGVDQGIPTLVMAASSCDDVLAISLFTVFLGITFSKGNLIFNIFRGPLELLLGTAMGCMSGVLLNIIPNKQEVGNLHEKRSILLILFGILLLFGSNLIKLSGAGALSVLTTAFVAAYGWEIDGKIPVLKAMDKLWLIFEPLMFGLIGAEIKAEYMSSRLISRGIATLMTGLLLRVLVTYFLTFGNQLNFKEKLFICIAWLPKATVQAAIGGISVETARQQGYSEMLEDHGTKILTLAVLVILLTAPLGAVGIALSGPRLLQRRINQLTPAGSVEEDQEFKGYVTTREEAVV